MSIPDVLTYVYIFVDLVRRGVLTLVGEIRRYRNDRYYLLYRPSISVHIALHASSLQVPPEYEQDPMCQKFNATDVRRTYCGMVKALDEGVGKIIATLKELNVLDDFFVIFTSDNGAADNVGASAWPLRGHKQTVYEVCKTWVLKGTHVQCMRFVNVCYRRDTVHEVCKTWVLKGTHTQLYIRFVNFCYRGAQCTRCVKPGC